MPSLCRIERIRDLDGQQEASLFFFSRYPTTAVMTCLASGRPILHGDECSSLLLSDVVNGQYGYSGGCCLRFALETRQRLRITANFLRKIKGHKA